MCGKPHSSSIVAFSLPICHNDRPQRSISNSRLSICIAASLDRQCASPARPAPANHSEALEPRYEAKAAEAPASPSKEAADDDREVPGLHIGDAGVRVCISCVLVCVRVCACVWRILVRVCV